MNQVWLHDNSDKKLKQWKGIIIPQKGDDGHSIALLLPSGGTLPVAQNLKSLHLQNLMWESVTVTGRMNKKEFPALLEVIYFAPDEGIEYSLDDEDDDEDFLEPQEIIDSVDYESMESMHHS